MYYGISTLMEIYEMEHDSAANGWPADATSDEDFLLDEELSELEVEDLLGCDVDFDEHDDWRTIDL